MLLAFFYRLAVCCDPVGTGSDRRSPDRTGIAAVAAALLFTAGRSKVQTGENTELSYLEQEMEELEAQVRIEEEQIDDFCTRWGLREGLELTSWLVELQNKRRDYEALLERQKQDGSDEKTARIAALQKDLQQFLQNTEKYWKHKIILRHCMNWRESADRDSFYWKTKEIFTAKTEIRSAGRTGKRLFCVVAADSGGAPGRTAG